MKTYTFKTIDVVAAIVAASEFQQEIVFKVDPDFKWYLNKPSAELNMLDPNKVDQTDEFGLREYITFPSVSDIAKVSLGMPLTKYMHKDTVSIPVTDNHKELAKEYIGLISSDVMMRILRNQNVTDFLKTLNNTIAQEEVTGRNIGLLSYVYKTAHSIIRKNKLDLEKSQYSNSQSLGNIGTKIITAVTILRTKSMPQYDSTLFEGVDNNGNLITFFKNTNTQAQFEAGKTYDISGKIKNTGVNDYSAGGVVNTLNYVRRVKVNEK